MQYWVTSGTPLNTSKVRVGTELTES